VLPLVLFVVMVVLLVLVSPREAEAQGSQGSGARPEKKTTREPRFIFPGRPQGRWVTQLSPPSVLAMAAPEWPPDYQPEASKANPNGVCDSSRESGLRRGLDLSPRSGLRPPETGCPRRAFLG
jgi:hypothetical protein